MLDTNQDTNGLSEIIADAIIKQEAETLRDLLGYYPI